MLQILRALCSEVWKTCLASWNSIPPDDSYAEIAPERVKAEWNCSQSSIPQDLVAWQILLIKITHAKSRYLETSCQQSETNETENSLPPSPAILSLDSAVNSVQSKIRFPIWPHRFPEWHHAMPKLLPCWILEVLPVSAERWWERIRHCFGKVVFTMRKNTAKLIRMTREFFWSMNFIVASRHGFEECSSSHWP